MVVMFLKRGPKKRVGKEDSGVRQFSSRGYASKK
jgi:hypothetical protein